MTGGSADPAPEEAELGTVLMGIAAVLDDVRHTLDEIETHVLSQLDNQGAPAAVQAFDRLGQMIADLSFITTQVSAALPEAVHLPVAPLLEKVRLAAVAQRLSNAPVAVGTARGADISLF